VDDRKWHDGVLRVLVCDEFPLFRRQVVIALEAAPDIEAVAEAPDAEVARSSAEMTAPDVVVLGTHLPPDGGVAAATRLREVLPAVEMVLVVDPEDERDERDLERALRAGVIAFVSRDSVGVHAVPVVRAAAAHRPVLDSFAAALVLASFDRPAPQSAAGAALAPPERAVLERLAGGEGITSTAGTLGIPVVTASNLVANALRKLERSARPAARTLPGRGS
jgi:DNA-binding NarL/FixJ family response regulator